MIYYTRAGGIPCDRRDRDKHSNKQLRNEEKEKK